MGSGPEVLAPTGATPCCRSKGPRSRVLFSHSDVAWWWGKGGEEKEVEAGRGRGGEEEEEEKLGEGPTFVLPPRAAPWRRGSVAAAVGRRSRGPRPNMGGKDAWSGRRCSTSARPAAAGRGGDERRTFVRLFSGAHSLFLFFFVRAWPLEPSAPFSVCAI